MMKSKDNANNNLLKQPLGSNGSDILKEKGGSSGSSDLDYLLKNLSRSSYNPKRNLEIIKEWVESHRYEILMGDTSIAGMIDKVISYLKEAPVAQEAAKIIKLIIGLEGRTNVPMPAGREGTIHYEGPARTFLTSNHIEEIASLIKKGIESPKPYLASEALGVILFMAAKSNVEANREKSLSLIGELANKLLSQNGAPEEIKTQFLKQVEGAGAINIDQGKADSGIAKAIEEAQKSLIALQRNMRGSGSALMEAEPAEFFSSEESEKVRKNFEQNMWVVVEDIKTILSALNSIDVNNDAFPNIRKDISSILMYLNTFNTRDARIEGKDIDKIVGILYKKGTSSEKSLFDILPKGYEVWLGGRSITLSGSVSELRRFQEAWESLEIDAEAVVKRIVGQTGAASEKYVKYIVERFREKIDRNPNMQETGEIIGYVIQNHKGNESLPEIVDEKIAEIMVSSSMETISKPAPKNAGGIDFRAMNYLVQPMGSFKDLRFGLPTLSLSALQRIDLDQELEALCNMVKAGMVPAGERVKEYLAACFQKGKIEEKQDDLLVCLAEIYRLAEEENLEISPQLRESLVIVDTGKFVLGSGEKISLS